MPCKSHKTTFFAPFGISISLPSVSCEANQGITAQSTQKRIEFRPISMRRLPPVFGPDKWIVQIQTSQTIKYFIGKTRMGQDFDP